MKATFDLAESELQMVLKRDNITFLDLFKKVAFR